MVSRLKDRIHAALDRHLPEQRLYLKSDEGMRFIRLRPGTQATILIGGALFIGWTTIVTSIFLIDTISAGSVRQQAEREQIVYRERLNAISAERDANLAAAHAAQQRFTVAMREVSDMQSRLLASEERRRELETAVDVIQGTLRRTMTERDEARTEAARYLAELESETGEIRTAAGRQRDIEATLDMLALALADTAGERDAAHNSEAEAYALVDQLQYEAALTRDRSERIFSQIEEAVAMSMQPLEEMFNATGLPTDQIIDQVRRGYSGQGGPLMPIMSTSGEPPDEFTLRANEVFGVLDDLNVYRLAAEQLPVSFPVQGSYRLSSPFGPRSGRMHEGTDLAGARGTPILATADGVVTFAGTQSGYGNMIEIRHAFGLTTRYAHLSRIRVSEGERVSRGDRIGDMGNTGRSTGPHLHYEVRRDGRPTNPMTFIRAGQDVF
ncbi:peptidoglycan DD-metalloendopeptidase family protein [Rhodobacterales bacterium HKCCE3408]|nr:peptidoglycan DD-metalloendopeptidase family protein [Rhodobacterales bacterium HKCCE3408]